MKIEIQKRTTFVEHSESKIGRPWTAADHVKLVRHLEAVDQLATAAFSARADKKRRNPALRGGA